MNPLLWPLLMFAAPAAALPGDSSSTDPAIRDEYLAELTLDPITERKEDGGRITQMAWGPRGPNGEERLYVATFDKGVHCFDYTTEGLLPLPVKVADPLSLGIAFHVEPSIHGAGGAVMYLAEFLGSGATAVLRRMTDSDGDGQWGGPGDIDQNIVDNIPLGNRPYGHHMNQIQIVGDTLYMGIGVGSDLGDNENAFLGTITWIEDLALLSGDTTTDNIAGLPIADFDTDPLPYTSTAPDKLRVHSNGTRNPFGLAVDGEGRLWATMNQIDNPRPGTGEQTEPQDQLFLAVEKADYAFWDGRTMWQKNDVTDWRLDPAVLAAGFFDPANKARSFTRDLPDTNYLAANPGGSSPLPHGLGPHSSADGFDFYEGNEMPLRWHQDAFVTRQSESVPEFPGPYEDIATVDMQSGEVLQVGICFRAPLDALEDAYGNVLIGEVSGSSLTRLYRIRATNPILGTHPWEWNRDRDGLWSQRTAWDLDLNGDGEVDRNVRPRDRKYPHQWGRARYAVSIGGPGARAGGTGRPRVTVDVDARIEALNLGAELFVESPNTLACDRLNVDVGGVLSGNGVVRGGITSRGTLSPGDGSGGRLTVVGNVVHSGTLNTFVSGPGQSSQLLVGGRVGMAGRLHVDLEAGYNPAPGTTFDVMLAVDITLQSFRLDAVTAARFRATIVSFGGAKALRLIAR